MLFRCFKRSSETENNFYGCMSVHILNCGWVLATENMLPLSRTSEFGTHRFGNHIIRSSGLAQHVHYWSNHISWTKLGAPQLIWIFWGSIPDLPVTLGGRRQLVVARLVTTSELTIPYVAPCRFTFQNRCCWSHPFRLGDIVNNDDITAGDGAFGTKLLNTIYICIAV